MTPDEINGACAERLGWKIGPSKFFSGKVSLFDPSGRQRGGSWEKEEDAWAQKLHGNPKIANFHGSMDAAMQLVERAKEMGWDCKVANVLHHELWSVTFCSGIGLGFSQVFIQAPTLPAAICAAFLRLYPEETV